MKRLLSLSFTTQVVLGVVLGIFAGLFFGERIASLEVIGTAYVRLLQMTILPYIMVSLVHGFGSLTREQAVKVAPRLTMVMMVFWVTGLTLVMVMPATFPDRDSASFFNPSVLEPVVQPSLIDLFIPSNPFYALAMGTIPAVVLFSILFGVALMGVDQKQGLLRSLGLVTQTLTRVTMMVVKMTPIGVFAMSAAAAGTMDVSEFARLQVYFTTYIAACLFLTFVVFPFIVSSCTPFKSLTTLKTFKPALVMAFTTGNLFVVLPLLMELTKKQFQDQETLESGSEYVDILAPVAFNFPNMGKLIALLFVFFGAWFVGDPIPGSEYPSLIGTGWVTFFGGIDLALPFMLSMQGLPADLFNIYSVSGVINGRFATLLASMELISITLIAGAWLSGSAKFHVQLRKLIPRAVGTVGGGFLMILLVGGYLEKVVPSSENHAAQLEAMHIPGAEEWMSVATADEPIPEPRGEGFHLFKREEEALKDLRVGYIPHSIPFAYRNSKKELVGYDVEMLTRMAKDMNLSLKWYPTTYNEMQAHLQELRLDIVASGISLDQDQIRSLSFTEPYEELILGLVIRVDQKEEVEKARKDGIEQVEATFAVIVPNPFMDTFRAALPKATFVEIADPDDYFDAEAGTYMALLTTMESGSAFAMLHPGYTTSLLHEGTFKKELVLAAGPENANVIRFVNDWLLLQKSKGTMDLLYEYWVRGQPRPNEEVEERWSILGDVLGWGAEPSSR